MRIISGKFKRSKIKFIKSSITRPLKDSVKENIFNILSHSSAIDVKIENSNILDFYSGVGSFGLECLSRGASNVIFFEKNEIVLKVLKENLIKFNFLKQSKVINDEVENFDKTFFKKKFDIFFFDPPFKDKNIINILKKLKKNQIYNRKHIFIIHRERNSDDEIDKNFIVLFSKQYGRSKIIFGRFI